jgi:hypothetical protein
MTRRKDSTNTLALLLILVVAIVGAYYGMVALTTHDPLWFLTEFEDRPSRIVVYHAGEHTELLHGDAGFNVLSTAVQASLAQGFARLTDSGYSKQTLREAYTEHLTLEVFWTRPIELHTWFPAGRTTRMLFPITGNLSEMSVVLLGDESQYRAGAPVLEDMEPIRQALRDLGYD